MNGFVYSWVVLGILTFGSPILAQWAQRQSVPQNCVTPDNYPGSCATLSYCPQVVNIFRTQNRRFAEQYVFALQRACGTRNINGDPVVCCTRFSANRDISINNPVTEDTSIYFPDERTTRPVPTRSSRNPQTGNSFLSTVRPTQDPTTEAPTVRTTPQTTTSPTTTQVAINSRASSCRGPDLRSGECIALEGCKELLDNLIAKQKDETYANFLRSSNAICGGTGSVVCCPVMETATLTPSVRLVNDNANNNEIPQRLPTEEEGCGYSKNAKQKVVGGRDSKKGEWPWVALLKYDDQFSSSPFKCGGTLITARHVLTAAHCIRRDLSSVRLGEHDLRTDSESHHVDINIVRKVAHPQYSRQDGHSDIAILYLERNVQFTDEIQPICMPRSPELRQKSYVKHFPFVVGWGKTMEGGKSADVLQELQIPIYDNSACVESYRKVNRLVSQKQFNAAVLCAGDLSGGKDTCQGDSGGPLMIPELYKGNNRYYLIGVVSYGVGCARPNLLGVYTSVQYFMDWIEEKVADTS